MKISQCVPLTCLAVYAAATLQAADTPLELARQLNEAFVEAAAKVSPAVVVITVTERRAARAEGAVDDDSDNRSMPDFWRRFHRQFEDDGPDTLQGQGSGVIIRKDGYILTNRHVVEDAEKIEVRLLDGRRFTATVRGVDPQSDVAVLKVDADELPEARFADSSRTRVGEFAIAIGAPFNLDHSVTFGHISATSRGNVIPWFMGGTVMDQDFIQTDANINPGNSGGPLINIDGEVVGINTLIRGLRSGIGFAIPSNLAREVAEKLIADGKVTRAWLGIEIHALRENQDFLELVPEIKDGVVVRAILPQGPAARSDLRPGDVIVSVDGAPVATPQQLRDAVRGKAVGEPMKLEVFRGGTHLKFDIEPGAYPGRETTVAAARPAVVPSEPRPAGFGLSVRDLTRELAQQFGVKHAPGVIVISVEERGVAARSGIKRGDIITAVDRQAITSAQQFADTLKAVAPGRGVLVHLMSGNTARFEVLRQAP